MLALQAKYASSILVIRSISGYSSVRKERLLWEQDAASSNLAIPTNTGYIKARPA